MRVVQVGYDMIAVSNIPPPRKIHSILDRHRTAALPFAGSTLLSQHYHDVPLLSAGLGSGPDRPALHREWRYHRARPFASACRPTPPSSPASPRTCLMANSAVCGWKRSRPTTTRPPARPLRSPSLSPWPAAFTEPLSGNAANKRSEGTAEVRRGDPEAQPRPAHGHPVPGLLQPGLRTVKISRRPCNPRRARCIEVMRGLFASQLLSARVGPDSFLPSWVGGRNFAPAAFQLPPHFSTSCPS